MDQVEFPYHLKNSVDYPEGVVAVTSCEALVALTRFSYYFFQIRFRTTVVCCTHHAHYPCLYFSDCS